MSLIHDSITFHNVAELEAVPGLAGLRLQRFFTNRADCLLDNNAVAAVRTPVFRKIVQRLVEHFDHPNVRFIEALSILEDPLSGLDSDLLHPSDEGHIAMGAALARRIAHAIPAKAR